MTWFKVDDGLAFHAKTVAAGNAAMGLWVRAGSWSAHYLTEGFVPDNIAETLGTKKEAQRLVESRLWTREDDGYRFWQWGEEGRQPSREQVEADRAASRERQRRARDKARESRRDGGVTHGELTVGVTVPPTRPDPTRPVVNGSVDPGSSPPLPANEPTTKIETLRKALQTLYRKPYSLPEAQRTADLVLAGRADVTDPVQYVLTAVKKDLARFAPALPTQREAKPPKPQPTDAELAAREQAAAAAKAELVKVRQRA